MLISRSLQASYLIALLLAGASAAEAATCGSSVGINQNFFTVTGASGCFATGNGQINHPSNQPFGPSSPFVYLDKTGEDSDPGEDALILGATDWSMNPPSGYSQFVLLLQQSDSPRVPDWAAFLLDALAGTWSISGSNPQGIFSPKTLSHAILYGEPIPTPIPGALVLFGSGLSVFAGLFGWLRRAQEDRTAA